MSSNGAKLDPRVRRTRQSLQHAFRELVQTTPFETITVQNIADRAGVNRATFYDHFADKYALLTQLIRETFTHILQQYVGTHTGLSTTNLERLVVAVCQMLVLLDPACQPPTDRFAPLVEAEVKTQLRDLLVIWLTHPDRDPASRWVPAELTATIASWAIYGAALYWSRGDRGWSAERFAREVLPVISAGVT